MDDDRISRLPEHVKHHILSFLREIRDVVRTSSLSKSWLQTWRTFEISDFQFWSVAPSTVGVGVMLRSGGGETETESFVRFVDGALTRSRDGMPRFRLYTTLRVAPLFDRWLGMALDNHVEELTLDINGYLPISPGDDRLRYSIPERVLSAGFIKSLTFSGYLKIDGISSVSLPSLRSLILEKVDINDQMFRGLLGGCRLLEDLTVYDCDRMPEIQVSDLKYLKSFTVCGPSLQSVSIRAPALESFSVDRRSTSLNLRCRNGFSLSIPESPNLRSLDIRADCVTDEWFCPFLYKFRMLESLRVCRCYSWKRIWILNPLLKKAVIMSCPNLVDIRVDTPELSSFYYEGRDDTRRIKLPSVWSEARPNSCAVGFTFSLFGGLNARWFEELQKSLPVWSTTFRCLEPTIHLCEWEDETMEVMCKKKLERLSAPGTLHLKLIFKASEIDYSIILDGFLSICRPTTILLIGTYPFRKFICEMLGNREETPLPDVRCWRHELKAVKITRIESTQHRGPLDWSTLFSLLPTLSGRDEVCFTLQWGDA